MALNTTEVLMVASQGSSGKESTYQCRRREFNPWVGKIPWTRKYQPTSVFLPSKFHGGALQATVHGLQRVGRD